VTRCDDGRSRELGTAGETLVEGIDGSFDLLLRALYRRIWRKSSLKWRKMGIKQRNRPTRGDGALISARQIRAARGLLGWSQERLCEEAGVSRRTLARMEEGGSDARVSTLAAIEAALERAGIELVSGEGKGEGVRLSRPE
jgi:DNA-binding XRE family transcriptional regulator